MKVFLAILFVLFGLLFVLNGMAGLRRGRIHYRLSGFQSDMFTRHDDGWLFWSICLFHLGGGIGIIIGTARMFLSE